MKKILLVLALCLTTQLFAEEGNIWDSFRNSQMVVENIAEVERTHSAKCSDGKIISLAVGPIGQISYVADCMAATSRFRVKIKASFKNKNNPVFKLRKIKVKKTSGQMFHIKDDQEFIDLQDPFIAAYKNSVAVKKLRHFVEDSYDVICRSGSASRGGLLARSKYSYRVVCKGAKRKVKLSMKSRVAVVGENSFKFNLQSYTIKF